MKGSPERHQIWLANHPPIIQVIIWNDDNVLGTCKGRAGSKLGVSFRTDLRVPQINHLPHAPVLGLSFKFTHQAPFTKEHLWPLPQTSPIYVSGITLLSAGPDAADPTLGSTCLTPPADTCHDELCPWDLHFFHHFSLSLPHQIQHPYQVEKHLEQGLQDEFPGNSRS